jgi:hypothetical protein
VHPGAGQVDDARGDGVLVEEMLLAANRAEERGVVAVGPVAGLDLDVFGEAVEALVQRLGDPLLTVLDPRRRPGRVVRVGLAEEHDHRFVVEPPQLRRLRRVIERQHARHGAVRESVRAHPPGPVIVAAEFDHRAGPVLPCEVDHAVRVARRGADLRADPVVRVEALDLPGAGQVVHIHGQLLRAHPDPRVEAAEFHLRDLVAEGGVQCVLVPCPDHLAAAVGVVGAVGLDRLDAVAGELPQELHGRAVAGHQVKGERGVAHADRHDRHLRVPHGHVGSSDATPGFSGST